MDHVDNNPLGTYLTALEEEGRSYKAAGESRAKDLADVEAEIERTKKRIAAAKRPAPIA